MNLQRATSRELISLGCEFSTKLEAISYLVDQLNAAGKLSDREKIVNRSFIRIYIQHNICKCNTTYSRDRKSVV